MNRYFQRLNSALSDFGDATASDEMVYPDLFHRSGGGQVRGRIEESSRTGDTVEGEYGQITEPKPMYKCVLPKGAQVRKGEELTHVDGRKFMVIDPIVRDNLRGWDIHLSFQGGGVIP